MKTHTWPLGARQPRRLAGGYNLMEVMVAMGIFAIGFVAVAAIFPVATVLQKETVEDAISQQFTRSAKAMMQGRGFKTTDLDPVGVNPTGIADSYRVQPLPTAWLQSGGKWTLSDRSYPSTVIDVYSRGYYWVPLVRCKVNPRTTTTAGDWQVFLFCLKRESNAVYARTALTAPEYWANPNDVMSSGYYGAGDPASQIDAIPGVRSIAVQTGSVGTTRFTFATPGINNLNSSGRPSQIAVGDQVLDSNGIIYNVASADGNGINVVGQIYPAVEDGADPTVLWYAPPGQATSGRPSWTTQNTWTTSPTRQLVILKDAVQ